MSEDQATFLTILQAVDAIALDFGEYGPQPDLFRKISPLVLGRNVRVPEGNRVRVRRNKSQTFIPLDDSSLGFYLIHILETEPPEPGRLARICSLVFQTESRPGELGGEKGVWIQDQMAGFICQRCGNCCKNLGNQCSGEDVEKWKDNREILDWVKREKTAMGETRYRIWVHSETGTPASLCPFYRSDPEKGRGICGIQQVKPRVCREYPFTKKHGMYTGCPGCGHPGSVKNP